MQRLLLSALLSILLTLAGCTEPTPAPEDTQVVVPTVETEEPTETAGPVLTATLTPTAASAPTETPTERPTAAEAATPAILKAPEATDERLVGAITPLMLDDAETFASEVSDSELVCMAGTASPERLNRIFGGQDDPTQEEWTEILGCLGDETQLRMFVGAFVEDPGPLSMEASECIRTAFKGINLRSVMLAATQDNELDDTLLSGVFVTIACLHHEEWETAVKALDLDPSERQITVCLMGDMGRTRGLTAALEAKAEGSNLTVLAQATGCGLEKEGGPEQAPAVPTATPEPGPDPATPEPTTSPVITTTILVAPVPPDIPEYDRSQWKYWVDADGDCQDTRQEVLIRESLSEATFETDRRCRVETGWWHGDFTRTRVNDPSELDIDHRVPLKNAHLSGGWAWSSEKKEEYANYLDNRLHLVAVTASANRSKGAKGPEEWRPPDEIFWCEYALYWTVVKYRWQLTMSKAKADAVMEMLSTCPVEVDVDVLVVDEMEEMWEPEPAETPESSVYRSCENAESAGEQRVQGNRGRGRGFPKAMLPSARDGDGNSVVCER